MEFVLRNTALLTLIYVGALLIGWVVCVLLKRARSKNRLHWELIAPSVYLFVPALGLFPSIGIILKGALMVLACNEYPENVLEIRLRGSSECIAYFTSGDGAILVISGFVATLLCLLSAASAYVLLLRRGDATP